MQSIPISTFTTGSDAIFMPHVLNKFAVYTDQTGQYVVLYELQARDSVAIESALVNARMSTNAAALARVELGLNVALAFARVNVFAVETINVPSTPYNHNITASHDGGGGGGGGDGIGGGNGGGGGTFGGGPPHHPFHGQGPLEVRPLWDGTTWLFASSWGQQFVEGPSGPDGGRMWVEETAQAVDFVPIDYGSIPTRPGSIIQGQLVRIGVSRNWRFATAPSPF